MKTSILQKISVVLVAVLVTGILSLATTAQNDNGGLLYITQSEGADGALYTVGMDGLNNNLVTTLPADLSVGDLAYDPVGDRIVYLGINDGTDSQIRMMAADGSNDTLLASATFAFGVDVNPSQGAAYYIATTGLFQPELYRVDLSNGNDTLLWSDTTVMIPFDVVVTADEQTAYVAASDGTNSFVMAITLSNGSTQTIWQVTGTTIIRGLALDATTNTLFFAEVTDAGDSDTTSVRSVQTDGTNPQSSAVVSDGSLYQTLTIDPASQRVYFGYISTGGVSTIGWMNYNLTGWNQVISPANPVWGIAVTDTLPVTPTQPTRLHPADGATLTDANASDWPAFSFEAMDGIEWYAAWVGSSDYSTTALYNWYAASEICDAGVCTLPADVWIGNGSYAWWMTYWSQSTPNIDSYWNMTGFSVNFAAPATSINLTAPPDDGTVSVAPSQIEWDRDANVLWYQVWVGLSNYSTTTYFNWVDATEICDATTCTLPLGSTLPNGDYQVWFEAWGPNGYMNWSGITSNPSQFTVTSGMGAPAR